MSRRVARPLLYALLGFTVASVLLQLALKEVWFTILPVLSLLLLAGSIGFFEGTGHMIGLIEKQAAKQAAKRIQLVGGPMDGALLPPPPTWDGETSTELRLEEHPEGRYVRAEGDRLVWEED